MNRRNLLGAPALGLTLAALPASTLLAQAPADKPATGAPGSGALEDIKRRGVLRVGLSTFVPWAMRAKSGDLVGFEVDVANRLAQDFGWKLELVPTAWDGIIPALVSGRFDVIIGGLSVTAQRNLTINFSEPYSSSGLSLFASKALAAGWSTLEAFNRPEVTLAARRGSSAAKAAQARLPKATLRQFDEETPAVQEVVNGRAHAMVASVPLPAHTVRRFPEQLFLPLAEPFQKSIEAFGVRKGEPDLLNAFDNWIRVNRDAGSFLKERNDYWFRTLDWEDQIQRT